MTTPSADAELGAVVTEEYVRYFQHLAARVEKAVRSLPREKLWVKPFAFGNSVGHLVLHLTGNLNHYVGAKLAATGYVRDRPHEFTDASEYPAEDVLKRFHEAVDLVVRTIRSLDAAALATPIDDEMPIKTRFGLLLVCAAHLNNHIGQLSYLVQAQGHSTQEPPVW
jgi:uncharacterized damage-inducible protein DinB